MTDTTAAPTPPPPAPARSPWARIGQIVIAAAVVIVGGIKLLSFFVLPGCDASNISDTVKDIFKGQNVELVTYNGIKTLSDADKTKTCAAYIESADEKANIEFSIAWQGWSPYVKIEKVDPIASAPPPGTSAPSATTPDATTPPAQ